MWRLERDEKGFSDAVYIAWEYVLPFFHLPIIQDDRDRVERLTVFLDKVFTKAVLKSTRKRLVEANNDKL